MKNQVITYIILSAISLVTARNAETRAVVKQLMEKQGYKFWGFSYEYGGYNITGEVNNRPDQIALDTNPIGNQTGSQSGIQKRDCPSIRSTCGAIFAVGNHLVLRTNSCSEAATNDDVLFCLDSNCVWLDNFLCNDFERGEQNVFAIPLNFRVRSTSTVIIEKFGNQLWQFQPLEIIQSPNGEFLEFPFSFAFDKRNCNCANGFGLTLNDQTSSCVNIFGGNCPRGYRFTNDRGVFKPFRTIG